MADIGDSPLRQARVFRPGVQEVHRRAGTSSAESRTETAPAAPQATNDTRFLRGVLWAMIVVFTVLIAASLINQLVIAPTLRISKVVLETSLPWDQATVLRLAGLEDGALFDVVDTQAVKARLEAVPQILEARVEKVFPDTLRLVLTSRVPLLQSMLADGTVVLIDEHGVFFDYVQTRTAHDLPILSGLEFSNFSLGSRLPESTQPFLTDLAALRASQPALYQAFSEFRVESDGGLDLEILCMTNQPGVPVRINSRLDAAAAGNILRVLDMLASADGFAGVRELDYRSRDVIIKKKEIPVDGRT